MRNEHWLKSLTLTQVMTSFVKERISPDKLDFNMHTLFFPHRDAIIQSTACYGSKIRRTWLMMNTISRVLWEWTNGKKKFNLGVTRDSIIGTWVHTLEKNRTSVLKRYWQRHTSDKNGIWYDMSPDVKRSYDGCLHAAAARSRANSNLAYALTLITR